MNATTTNQPRPKHDVGHVGLDRGDLPPIDAGPIEFSAWFPNSPQQPLELEIGSGKGTFLVRRAKVHPGVNYIGLEYAREFWRYAADRCRRHNLANVRLVHAEAEFFLRCYVPPDCFQQIHIYFPDPWPKRRHNKRRLIQEPSLRLLHTKLAPAATIRIATDHEEYFHWILEHTQRVDDLFEQIPFVAPSPHSTPNPQVAADSHEPTDMENQDDDAELVGTNFERKYRLEGRRFFTLALLKR